MQDVHGSAKGVFLRRRRGAVERDPLESEMGRLVQLVQRHRELGEVIKLSRTLGRVSRPVTASEGHRRRGLVKDDEEVGEVGTCVTSSQPITNKPASVPALTRLVLVVEELTLGPQIGVAQLILRQRENSPLNPVA